MCPPPLSPPILLHLDEPLRTSLHKNAIVAVFRYTRTHYLRHTRHQLLPIILVLSYFVLSSFSYRFISCACSAGVPHVTSSRRTVAVHIVKVHRRMRTPALLLAHVRACAYVLCTRGLRGRYNTSCGPFYDVRITYVCEYTRKRSRAQSRAHSRESVRTRARLSAVEHRTQCRKSVA